MKAIDFLPIGLGIACYVIAKYTGISDLQTLGGALVGLSLPRLSALLQRRADAPAE